MRKLTRQAVTERDTFIEQLHDTYAALEKALEVYNAAMAAGWEAVETAVDAHNDALANAKQWADDLVEEMEAYQAERSEKWLDSEAGQAYERWKREYEYLELDTLALEQPEPVELESGDPAENIEALDDEPSA